MLLFVTDIHSGKQGLVYDKRNVHVIICDRDIHSVKPSLD